MDPTYQSISHNRFVQFLIAEHENRIFISHPLLEESIEPIIQLQVLSPIDPWHDPVPADLADWMVCHQK